MSNNVIEFSIRALDDFSANMGKLQGSLSGLTGAFAALGVTAAAYTALNMGRTSLENAEAMGVAAEKANMTTEAFSALAWAARQSNVEQGSLTTGLKMLGRAMAEGDASQAGKSLKELGVAATDANGKLRPTADVLLDVADKFSGAAQDATKTKVAMELFGRSGVDMVPMLNQGKGAIQEMMKEAKQLGFVISDDFAKSADQVNDNLAAMSQVMKGQVNVAMEQLAPTIELITGTFIDMAKEGDTVKSVGESIAVVFKTLFTTGMAAGASYDFLTSRIGQVIAMFTSLGMAMKGDVIGAMALQKEAADDVRRSNDALNDSLGRIKGMWDGTAQSAAAASAKQMRAAMAKAEALRIANKEEEDAITADIAHSNAMNELVKGLERANATYGMSADQVKLYTLMVNDADEALIRLAADAVATSMAQEEASKRATVGTQEYKDAATSTLATLNDLFIQQQEQAGSIAYQTAAAMQNTFNTLATGVGNAVASAVVDGKSLLDAMGDVLKQVVKSIIATYITLQVQRAIYAATGRALDAKDATGKISTSTGELFVATWADVAENMPYGWAYGEAIAAGVAASAMATGMGFVAAGGAAHGGLDYVPAEATYLLDKGERVLSPRQNQDLASFMESGGGGGLVVQNLSVHVLENATNVDAFARMDRVQLRNALGQPVIDALNEMFSIGVRPNFAMQTR